MNTAPSVRVPRRTTSETWAGPFSWKLKLVGVEPAVPVR